MYNPRILSDMIQAMPEHLSAMAIKNCHVNGLHSIVFQQHHTGPLYRMYLCSEDHDMWQNEAENDTANSLGVHDHKYSLSLRKVFGDAYNVMYERVRYHEAGGDIFDQYTFGSGITHKDPFVLPKGKTCLDYISSLLIDEGIPTLLGARQLHTVYVPKGKTAAWLVEEGKTESSTSNLFLNEGVEFNSTELQRFENLEEIFKTFDTAWKKHLEEPEYHI